MTPTDAVYGFAAWLTCRKDTMQVGYTHDAAAMADCAKKWCEANGIPEVSDAYPDNIVQPAP